MLRGIIIVMLFTFVTETLSMESKSKKADEMDNVLNVINKNEDNKLDDNDALDAFVFAVVVNRCTLY